MSGSTRSRLVVTDANVLINLAHVKRLGLLGSLPGYEFVVPPEVEAEVTAPPQSSALEQAFGSGLVKKRSFTTTEELRLFAEHVKVIGSGEAACLAMAEVHGWYVASDERRKFLRLSIERLGTGRVLPEVRVFGDYGETVFAGILPHVGIVRSLKVYIANVNGIRINACQSSRQSRIQILVDQQPHSDGTETNWRSRSAANAKQARMSARSRSGKSERI